MGDLSWEAILCAAAPVVFVVAVLARSVRRAIRRRGAPSAPLNPTDAHVQAFDAGRPPVQPERWNRGGPLG